MFKRVVIWGHPLHSHTQSYVHAGYARGFEYLGFETHWLDGSPSDVNLDGALVFTEGQVDRHLAVHPGASYVTHNCDVQKYLSATKRVLALQVWTYDVIPRPGEDFAPFVRYSPSIEGGLGTIYQPWAAYLLPNEINDDVVHRWRDPMSAWVGFIGGGQFGNQDQVAGWRSACEKNQIPFVHQQGISFDAERDLIRRALLAPAIAGRWQRDVGLLPCRAWKVASHGHVVATNSKTVAQAFDGLAVFNEDTHELLEQVLMTTEDRDRMSATVAIVRDKHTYVNRCRAILRVFDQA